MEKNTAQTILDVAQGIVRSRGYSAFSYADISDRVGIRKASIHYHFPSKDDLVRKLVERYREMMVDQCDRISQSNMDLGTQLRQFAELYRKDLKDGQICLCAMLASDFAVLSQPIQDQVQRFFRETEAWLTNLLQQGCDAGLWQCRPSATLEARGLIALLQGAQLLARSAENQGTDFEQLIYPLLAARFSGRDSASQID